MKPAIHRPAKVKIHLEHLAYNIEQIKKHIGDRQFFAVVKADAYGHGAVEIARKASQSGVDGFCVALLDEALELRETGIREPILVMGLIDPKDVQLAIDESISVTVSSMDFLEEAEKHIETGKLVIHLALNTGMNRIGLQTREEVVAFEKALLGSDKFVLDGVFTHYATADGENEEKVKEQTKLFEDLLSVLQVRPRLVHGSNSAMTLWRPQVDSDLVRVGIGMYGLNPSDFALELPFDLKPVLTWETEISFVHLLKKGESVSYGARYVAQADEWVGTLPIGYADGWHRALGDQQVYIGEEACDILGVVCMDQMMIRLSQPYPVGTKVELIGQHNSASSLGVAMGTIGYEILCGISPRVYREYID